MGFQVVAPPQLVVGWNTVITTTHDGARDYVQSGEVHRSEYEVPQVLHHDVVLLLGDLRGHAQHNLVDGVLLHYVLGVPPVLKLADDTVGTQWWDNRCRIETWHRRSAGKPPTSSLHSQTFFLRNSSAGGTSVWGKRKALVANE